LTSVFYQKADFIGLANKEYYGVPSMNLIFRDYSLGDVEAYVNIWNESFRTFSWYSKHPPATIEGARKEIEQNRKESTYRLIFAILENRHIGFIEANMEDVNIGRIFPYRPCILPTYRRPEVEAALVRVAMEHLRKCGAEKVKFSIMGVASDVMPYVNLYQSLGFEIWRKAQSMRRSLENIPECKTHLPLTIATARYIGVNAFVNLFIQCFKDSSDRDASLIASNIEKTKKFMQELGEREGQYQDLDG
jgi:ribosomal protein S18 acetylase RimI-like enzyme